LIETDNTHLSFFSFAYAQTASRNFCANASSKHKTQKSDPKCAFSVVVLAPQVVGAVVDDVIAAFTVVTVADIVVVTDFAIVVVAVAATLEQLPLFSLLKCFKRESFSLQCFQCILL